MKENAVYGNRKVCKESDQIRDAASQPLKSESKMGHVTMIEGVARLRVWERGGRWVV